MLGDIDSLLGDVLLSGLSGRIAAGAPVWPWSSAPPFVSWSGSEPDRDDPDRLVVKRVRDGKSPPPPPPASPPYMDEYDDSDP